MKQVHIEWQESLNHSFIVKLHVILFSSLMFFSSESWENHNLHLIICDYFVHKQLLGPVYTSVFSF